MKEEDSSALTKKKNMTTDGSDASEEAAGMLRLYYNFYK